MRKIILISMFAFLVVGTSFGQLTNGQAAKFNENAAYRTTREIVNAQYAFRNDSSASYEFASSLRQLILAGLLDRSLSSGEKYGYIFDVIDIPATHQSDPQFKVTATPSQFPKSGRKSFFSDETGLIHAADIGGAVATINQPEFIVCGTNESLIFPSLRTIASSESTYASSIGAGNYADLTQLRAGNLIGSILASGQICGYTITIRTVLATQTTAPSYSVYATPQNYPNTGIRSYYTNERGRVYAADIGGAVATGNEPEYIVCGANESQVIPTLRLIFWSEKSYSYSAGAGNYGTLKQLRADDLIGSIVSSGQICGYSISIQTVLATQTTAPSYSIQAVPQSYPNTGTRSFYTTEAGIIYGADKQGLPANSNDPTIIQ